MQTVVQKLDKLNWCAPLVFAGIYALWTTILMPGEFLVLAAGYVFPTCLPCSAGWSYLIATLSVLLGLWAGGTVLFMLSRHVMKERVMGYVKARPVVHATLLAFDDGGLWFLFLFRASPLMPFAIANLVLGLTSIPYLTWNIGLLGCLPSIMFSIYFGSHFKSFEELFHSDSNLWHEALKLAFPLSAAILCATAAYLLVKRRVDSFMVPGLSADSSQYQIETFYKDRRDSKRTSQSDIDRPSSFVFEPLLSEIEAYM